MRPVEIARVLAKFPIDFDDERALARSDMSEYRERHVVSSSGSAIRR